MGSQIAVKKKQTYSSNSSVVADELFGVFDLFVGVVLEGLTLNMKLPTG